MDVTTVMKKITIVIKANFTAAMSQRQKIQVFERSAVSLLLSFAERLLSEKFWTSKKVSQTDPKPCSLFFYLVKFLLNIKSSEGQRREEKQDDPVYLSQSNKNPTANCKKNSNFFGIHFFQFSFAINVSWFAALLLVDIVKKRLFVRNWW